MVFFNANIRERLDWCRLFHDLSLDVGRHHTWLRSDGWRNIAFDRPIAIEHPAVDGLQRVAQRCRTNQLLFVLSPANLISRLLAQWVLESALRYPNAKRHLFDVVCGNVFGLR